MVSFSLPNQARSTSWILSARSNNGYKDIWIRRQWILIGKNNDQTTDELWVYSNATKKWIAFPEKINNTNISVGGLYTARNGSLWSHNYVSKSDQPLFSLYNEKNKRFELKDDSLGMPDGWVLLDQKDIFWVIPHQDSIYSYDPATHRVTQHSTLPGLVVYGAALAPDGSIYILKGTTYLQTSDDEELFRFYPETEKIERIGVPLEPHLVFFDLLVDHLGRLWLNDYGWMEPDGTWYQIIRSPIFITNNVESGLDRRWKTPSIILESSDGRLWFKSENGMAWLDPQNGKWCWFTTYQSDLIEDQQHNLWMIANGKLYKLELGK